MKIASYKFHVRENSSDEKAIDEVLIRNSYRRKDFPITDSFWIDLGANIGVFSVLAAKCGAEVEAYEPDPESFELLKLNVECNGLADKVKIFNKGVVVGDPSSMEFHINSANKNYWRNSFVKKWRGGETKIVETINYRNVIRSDVSLKMDIEGSEMKIIEDMEIFPSRFVFEWSFDIDRSIPRFNAAIKKLSKIYNRVYFRKFDHTILEWPGSWFPPAVMVWCYK